ncbi:hypothetical protein HMPREF9719_00108 [Corynebacterium otitidis ATCC 51513]|mgnify:CR=1 FL=1|uniref:Secreted protein n=2 Tax=Corynebacterium otitidis TaxID=29321 RepID=K0YHI3_9CORY|nr:hypothetical protein [Corynebacterium otitidis]EJZ82926.1 hypothetical protein HMPREF9719_00108 [Corynebacterium otitidis ATCC 51513]
MTLRRPILALTAGLAALPVAGCSYLAGPTPDEGLVALGQSLRDAAGQAADSGEAELLSSHADEVFDEVIRLCGTTEQGALPRGCDVDLETLEVDVDSPGENGTSPVEETIESLGGLGAPPELLEAVRDTLAAAVSAPEESRDLLGRQLVDLLAAINPGVEQAAAAISATSLTDLPAGDAAPDQALEEAPDTIAARDLAGWEDAIVFGLSSAQAWDSGDGLEEDLDTHRLLHSALTTALDDAGGAPAPAASYDYDDSTAPSDQASAEEFREQAAEAARGRWLQAAGDAEEPDWQLAAALTAAALGAGA